MHLFSMLCLSPHRDTVNMKVMVMKGQMLYLWCYSFSSPLRLLQLSALFFYFLSFSSSTSSLPDNKCCLSRLFLTVFKAIWPFLWFDVFTTFRNLPGNCTKVLEFLDLGMGLHLHFGLGFTLGLGLGFGLAFGWGLGLFSLKVHPIVRFRR